METNTLEGKLKVCAGLDIHAKTVVACVLIGSLDPLRAKKEIRTFGNTYILITFAWWVVNGKKSWKNSNGNLTNNPRSEKRALEIISAKINPNLEKFASAKQLTSWTGLCPASYKSGGVRKSAHNLAGSKYLKTLLYQCSGNAGRSSNIIFSEFYGRISRRGSIACAHKILRMVYKFLSEQPNRVNKKILTRCSEHLVRKNKKFLHPYYSIGKDFFAFFYCLFH